MDFGDLASTAAHDTASAIAMTAHPSSRMSSVCSGGRVSTCKPGRAILADEPTGSLDPEMTDEVIDLLRQAAHQLGKCVIVVTHSKRVADSADAVYTLRHKKLAKA